MIEVICKKCRRDIPPDARFCCYCGASTKEKPRSTKKRGNGQGTVYQRSGRKTWEARIVVGWKFSKDQTHRVPVWSTKGGFTTKREAVEALVALRKTIVREKKAQSLEHYYLSYCESEMKKLSKSKQTAYRGAWAKLKNLHHRIIDTIEISELRKEVADKCPSYYTARDCKVLLNHLFELAGAEGVVSKDIPSYIILPDLKEKERQVFSDEEQKALWRNYEDGDIDAAIPLVMICTGMMPGEMQALKVEHINLDDQQIIGVGMKTKVRKQSPIFLPEDIIPMMEDLIANAQASGYIFRHNEDLWYESYYGALERAGCRRLEPYCCRHSTATRLAITEGVAPQTIQRMMRWSTTKMLDRYAHPDSSDVLAAANMIRKIS